MSRSFHGVSAPRWESDEGLVAILREEAREDSGLHITMWNTERDQALLLTAADRIEELHKLAWFLDCKSFQEMVEYDHGS